MQWSDARGRLLAGVALALFAVAAQVATASQRLPARGSVEVAFSPADRPEALLIDVIDDARKTLHVQAYAFTSKPIAHALIGAHRRGVRVEVLADAKMNKRGKGNVLPDLLAAGIPVSLETRFAAAHNKVMIADAEGPACALVTGSFNFTKSAVKRNAENLLVLRDNCTLTQIYLDNWRRHRADATRVTRLPWKPGT
ncbi:phospholipase D family protein [Aromatoleum evansii]|uniref:phospholipase D n=1 Tax=Aromatoleum evansii TaxID=59406 RepID=A0ABZ1AK97_AROEV|nr:phospholipase D family protein [Aromatoleum evansii]NMG28463.1 phospholipase D family protein [Aromatoleum evansii]WRL45426.1 phospholipase D family protein [Aromatoleum evansii]